MKYLSKYYRPAEKECFKLIEDFRKMIKLEEETKQSVHPDLKGFLETMHDLLETIDNEAEKRVKKEEKKLAEEEEERANYTAECPRCNETVPVTVVGEIKVPKTGFTHYQVRCKVCKKEFTNQVPIGDEESIKWTQNILKTMYRIEPDGRPFWQCASIPHEEVLGLEQAMQTFKEAVEKEKEAFRAEAEIQAHIDKAIDEMRDALLVMRIKLQQWNAGDAKA